MGRSNETTSLGSWLYAQPVAVATTTTITSTVTALIISIALLSTTVASEGGLALFLTIFI
jgi:hypothetical protein